MSSRTRNDTKIATLIPTLQKTSGHAETKPFTNFSVFHDNLISRLKQLSQIQLEFDKRCKAAESRYSERLNEMRRQLEARWRQIDKFEASVKVVAEAKASWRRKLAAKDGEIEGLKVCVRCSVLRLGSFTPFLCYSR